MRSKFKIKGLDCANCAAELERAIQKINGIIQNVKKVIKKEEPDVTIEEV